MNKTKLKRFAIDLRNELIDEVKNKIDYIINLDDESMPAFYRNHTEKVAKLKEQHKNTGIEKLSEQVAYTWANRLIALRYMDIKKINSPMVITPKEGEIIPEIFSLAKRGDIDKSLHLDRNRFFDLIDGKINAADAQNEAYSMLFIAICNSLNDIMPFLFERIGDFRELLLPSDLLSKNSIRARIVDNIKEEDAQNVEIIGWFYQFYIAEKKDIVFADLKKNKKITPENIPSATQLFTPHWIVRYLVENSLGKLWMLNHPDSNLKEYMKYYIDTDETDSFIHIESPEEITFLDPCCGSGHILTYAFDLFVKIYEEEGYNRSEIPSLILQNNIFGCDIDERAASLANFALIMKAREYHKRFFRKKITPNIIALRKFNIEEFDNIDNVGSLLRLQDCNVKKQQDILFEHIYKKRNFDLQCKILTSQFHCCVTNPPYMGSKGMNRELSDFVKQHYPDSKSDLFAAFMERCLDYTQAEGFTAMITMQSWMFLSSFEKLRVKILKNYTINTLAHLGNMVMGIAFGTSAFVLQKIKPNKNSSGVYFKIDLKDLDENREIKGLK